MALAGDDQGGARAEGGDDRAEAGGRQPLGGVVEGEALRGHRRVEALRRERQAELAVAGAGRQAGALGAPHDALHLGVARVAEGLREPDDGRGAAVRRPRDLVGRQERHVGEVVGEVPGEGLLGGAEALVVALEALGQCVDVGGHAASFRRRRPVPYRDRACSITISPGRTTIRTESTSPGAAPRSTT